MADNTTELKECVNARNVRRFDDEPTFILQPYDGQLELKISQKRAKVTIQILSARHIRGYDKLHVEVTVYGVKPTPYLRHRTQSISNIGVPQWNDKWNCNVALGQHRYVILSLWNTCRSSVDEPSDLVGCMTFKLQQTLPKIKVVVAYGSYYLFNKSLGARRHLKVKRPFGLCALFYMVHMEETKNITEQHRVILQLNPPTDKFGLKLRGTEKSIVSVIQTHGPAERAGLKIGDVITSVNKTDVTGKDGATVKELIRMHDHTKPLFLTVTRNHSDSILSNVVFCE